MLLNKLTLKFKDAMMEVEYRKYKIEHTHRHLPLFFGLSGAAGLYSIIRYLITGERDSLIIFATDCMRTLLYLAVYFLAPKIRMIRPYIGTIANIIFAFFLTEVYLYIDQPFFLVLRYLAYQSLVVLGLAEMNINFLLSMGTLWICKCYVLSRALIKSYEFMDLIIFVMINSFIVSSVLLYHVVYNNRQKFQEVLKNEELYNENLKMAMSIIPDGFIQIQDSRVIFANKVAKEMLKISYENDLIEGPPMRELLQIEEILSKIREDDPLEGEARSLWELALDVESACVEESKYEKMISESQYNPFMQVICKYMNIKGSSVIILLKDLQDLHAINKEKTENKYENLLLMTFSHELRTPLNNFASNLDLLKDYITPGGECFLIIIENSYELLLALVNDTLDYFKMKQGGISLRLKSFNVKSAVFRVTKLFSFQAESRGVQIELNTNESTPLLIYNDKARFRQVLLNILNNAVKYTFDGKISIYLTGRTISGMRYLDVKIKDTGIGINADLIPKLGKMFGLIDSNSNNKRSGVGLGLSLAKNLLVLMGGDIKINSVQGQGTVVKFWVKASENEEYESLNSMQNLNSSVTFTDYESLREYPINSLGEEAGQRTASFCFDTFNFTSASAPRMPRIHSLFESHMVVASSHGSMAQNQCDCPRILVVDDNAFNQFSLMQFLRRLGIKADKADSGDLSLPIIQAAAQKSCCGGYQLVFMDIQMPGLNGYETSRIIKDQIKESGLPDITIIACTAHESDNHEELCAESGIIDSSNLYVFKPVAMDVLRDKLILYEILAEGMVGSESLIDGSFNK